MTLFTSLKRKKRTERSFLGVKDNITEFFVNLKDIKKQGLEQLANQMGIYFDKDNMSKAEMINLLDPNLRTIDKQYYLAIGKKLLAYSNTETDTEG